MKGTITFGTGFINGKGKTTAYTLDDPQWEYHEKSLIDAGCDNISVVTVTCVDGKLTAKNHV